MFDHTTWNNLLMYLPTHNSQCKECQLCKQSQLHVYTCGPTLPPFLPPSSWESFYFEFWFGVGYLNDNQPWWTQWGPAMHDNGYCLSKLLLIRLKPCSRSVKAIHTHTLKGNIRCNRTTNLHSMSLENVILSMYDLLYNIFLCITNLQAKDKAQPLADLCEFRYYFGDLRCQIVSRRTWPMNTNVAL